MKCRIKYENRKKFVRMHVKIKRFIIFQILLLFIFFLSGFLVGLTYTEHNIENDEVEKTFLLDTPILFSPILPEIEEVEWQTFKATAYCPCKKCCDKNDGITASGVKAKEGITIAADWDVLPAGTEVEIQGIGTRIVQDKGGAIRGNRIDIFFENHRDALNFGVQEVLVRIKE